ncbi:glycoside hydrolase family 26 protein [Streptomyces yokosukanensis]|uniref:glycoside hydrolase family 26 protein n=1 Tax=Streptomyces yokosukanensis TaxID=67386 RepID=UPI00082DA82C|nr:glycosyl hydrolase [Streptomyces yokosukanensis]
MTPERLRSLRRVTFLAAGVFAAATVLPNPALKAGSTADLAERHCPPAVRSLASACPANGAKGPSPGPAAPPPAFGAYLNYGPLGVLRMQGLSAWLDHSEVRVGHTYLAGDVWSNIEAAPGFLDSWAQWRRGKDDRLLVLNVPMMERNEDHLPDAEVKQLLGRAAAGEFDRHFRTLAEHLVALGVPDTIVVLGWEMNGITYTHRCGPDPADWKTYWRRIVTVMRSVRGAHFTFDFAPNRGADAVPWPQCYPGDDVVDVIGMDSYDQPAGITFDQQVSEPYGLKDQVDFATAHGKPISYPEWGLFRNGDNVSYVLRMLAWFDEHRPLYQTITDYCPHGVWLCSTNPRASALYRAALAGRRPPPEGPKPPVPASPGHEPNPAPDPAPARPSGCPCDARGRPLR